MKQIILLVLCVVFSNTVRSQKTEEKNTEKFVMLKITEQKGEVIAIDTLMVDTLTTPPYVDLQVIDILSDSIFRNKGIHFMPPTLPELDSLIIDMDKVYAGNGVSFSTKVIPNAYSSRFMAISDYGIGTEKMEKEIEALHKKLEKLNQKIEALIQKEKKK